MIHPDVTIVIAAWNAEATLGRAIDSALSQQGVAVEVLVIDDASSDGTAALAERRAGPDGRLRLLRMPRNGGPAAARNMALTAARAAWIAPLDADDMMEPERIRRLLDIASDEDADMVADDLWRQEEADRDGRTRCRLFSDAPIGRVRLDAASFVSGNLSSRHGGRRELGFVKPLMRKDFLDRHGLRYPDLRLGEDYALYTRALLLGARFVLTDPAGYVAIVREGSLSGRHPTEVHGALAAEDRALLAMPQATGQARRVLRAHLREVQKEWAWRRMIDAVRGRDPLAAARCLAGPPAVSADLVARLGREAMGRMRARVAGRPAGN
ncbi:glycosyltransferase family 2 protein [Wenxinia saemankumensis]|uniref:Succinoglycan biosynthesis protein ExoU n=1 Tax=Wenxinia saemankumensis TaxID=1447782 RepID=A0A1M5ZYH2_9RHOB|nr:glycosyltransferase family 2 protein [Wenxinia saemankumensis]SHI29325.1 succinoglycan biosynthesis protein ExoU [Wenxinia saemankumensis]